MKTLGTCRTDDRQAVAAVTQTACCIVLSLPAGSLPYGHKRKRVVRSGRNNPSESIADGGSSRSHRCRPAGPPSSIQPFHCVLGAQRPGLRSTAECSQSTPNTSKKRKLNPTEEKTLQPKRERLVRAMSAFETVSGPVSCVGFSAGNLPARTQSSPARSNPALRIGCGR